MADPTQMSLDALIWRRCPRCSKDYLRDEFKSSHCRSCHAAYEHEKRRRSQPSIAIQRRDERERLKLNGLKRCADCHEIKAHSEFHPHRASRDGWYPYCKPCESERNRRNRERRGGAYEMAARAKRYGLTVDGLTALLAKGRCDACGATDPGGKAGWHIDHDHRCCEGSRSCGECVRGLLCVRCNVALGMSDDSPARLLALVSYLETTMASRVPG